MSQERLALNYLAEKNCSTQWRFFLSALGEELVQTLSEDKLRIVMRQLGQRVATQLPLGDCSTLQEIQNAANLHWDALNWGWVELSEHASYLRLRHYCAPVLHAFGSSAAGWSPAFLEGVYQQWLASIGASSALRVIQSSQLDVETEFVDYHLSA